MATQWKLGVQNSVAIDLGSDDVYGATGFKCVVANTKNRDQELLTEFSEGMINIENPQSCLCSEDTTDTREIAVDDVTGWEVGMVAKVKDKEIYFYVQSIDADNNILTARKTITDTIAKDDEIDQVGNTGLYGATFTPDLIATYHFLISNPSIDLLNEVARVEVVEHNKDDIFKKLEDIEKQIDSQETRRVKVLV